MTVTDSKGDMKQAVQAIRLDGRLKPFEKKQQMAFLVIGDLKEKGFFVITEEAKFFFWDESRRLFGLLEEEFGALVNDWYGINRSEQEWRYLIESLVTEAIRRGRKSEVYRLARYQGGVLYVSRFDGNMYRLNGKSIELVPNGSEGVLFVDGPTWQPYEYQKVTENTNLIYKTLIEPINFSKEGERLTIDEQRLLFMTWLYSLFFESQLPTKPILVLVGPHGSGKSATLRWDLRFLFGEKAELTSLAKGKEDAFIAAVTSGYIVVCDNVDDRIGWLNDHLARLSTGGAITLRKLYTTNEGVTYCPRVFLCITSRTPEFRREDVADRLLVFHVERIENFMTEGELLQEIVAARNQMWTEMLNNLNRIVDYLKQGVPLFKSSYRMADFAKLAWHIAGIIYGQGEKMLQILDKMETEKREFALQEDCLYLALSYWLQNSENHGKEVSTRDLFEELARTGEATGMPWTYDSPQALGIRLSGIKPSLEGFFIVKEKTGAHNQRVWQFWPKE